MAFVYINGICKFIFFVCLNVFLKKIFCQICKLSLPGVGAPTFNPGPTLYCVTILNSFGNARAVILENKQIYCAYLLANCFFFLFQNNRAPSLKSYFLVAQNVFLRPSSIIYLHGNFWAHPHTDFFF